MVLIRRPVIDTAEPLETLVDIGLWNEVITMSGTTVNKYLAPLRNQGVGDEG